MKKLIIGCAMAVVSATCVYSAEKPYVAFINVKQSVESNLFAKVVNKFVPTAMPVRTKALALPAIEVSDVAIGKRPQSVGAEAKILVFIINQKGLPNAITVPGQCSILNLAPFDLKSDPAKLEDRIQRLVLKGLAYACGFGANQDVGRCVMGAGSFDSVKGLDETSASYSPFVTFPMMDYLTERGLMAGD